MSKMGTSPPGDGRRNSDMRSTYPGCAAEATKNQAGERRRVRKAEDLKAGPRYARSETFPKSKSPALGGAEGHYC